MYKISINDEYMTNKNVDYRIYLSFMIDSVKENDINYISENKYFGNKEYLLKKMNIKRATFNKMLNIFLDNRLIVKTENKGINIYKNNIVDNFINISDEELYKLIGLSNNEIKTYLVIKNELKDIYKKEIELNYIKKKIGLEETNPKTLKKIITSLESEGLISYTYFYVNNGSGGRFKKYLFFNKEIEQNNIQKYNLLEAIKLMDDGNKITLYNHEYYYKNIKSYFYKRGNEYIYCDVKTKKEKDLQLEDLKIYNSHITLKELLNLQFVIYE